MSKEILVMAEVVSNEKGVDKEVIFEAVEAALVSATKKLSPLDIEVSVKIDRRSGNYQTFRLWSVVDDEQEIERPDQQMALTEARQIEPDIEVGGVIEKQIESIGFGRIAAQTAKNVIIQKVREAERALIVKEYLPRKGELITGVVKRIDKGNVILDLGGHVEGIIFKEDMMPKDVRIGDRIRGYLYDVRLETRGPQLFISRTCPELLIELFKLEVPEAGEGLISIIGAARDPGSRAKVSVRANDPRIDPVGACVGMRGSRVQAVINELGGERIDIILWDENSAQFVINAMSPAEVMSIVVDEEAHSMDIAVKEKNLSQAIGKGGQNVRLASHLTGWELNVMTEAEAEEKSVKEHQVLREIFMQQLEINQEVADILVMEGFSTIEEVAYVPVSEMLAIEEFDEEIVEELRDKAKDVLLTKAIASEEQNDVKPAVDLLSMEGMDEELAYTLARHGICSMEDLAEQAVDDLIEIVAIDANKAAELIMTARSPWFSEGVK